MTDLPGFVLEPLWDDGEFVLSRRIQDGTKSSLLVLSPVLAQPAPGSLRRLEHAYELRDELDPAWAVRPLELVRHQGQPTLLLEDPGGEPLARLMGQPWEVRPFLCIALGLAGVLGQCHARGLIHKDLNPVHILVNMTTGEVRLTGFGLASRVPRERLFPEPPAVIAGTLAYMAPEQTGRMNRSIDSRSDLYAYGVILYEMLTGTLPFTATDPLEWIHCHIARHPTPPSERVPGISAPIAAIVMKLLAKTPEERYQTAAGVEADLRTCLVEWESHGCIEPFPLGMQDVPDQLLIPEKLYGREREIDTLLAAFERVVASGTPELVLVSGYSGIGKSSVVNELHKVLVPTHGLFASGKFDQYKRDIPYATLAQALQSLVRPILGQNEAELNRWRDAMRQAVGPNGQLIVNLIPKLELVIGKQPPVPDVPPQDAQKRFHRVFQRFLSVFARSDHPLALFLDDLQWLDVATLDLLEHLVTESEVQYLLLIGAYRDNEVGPSHPLRRSLDAIRKATARVHDIVLAPLALDDVVRLVAEAVHLEREDALPLAQLVYEKTAGNPFFAIQFVAALAEERLIAFDPHTMSWTCDLARIRATGYTDNVIDFLIGKLHRLPSMTQEALKWLACLGNRADTTTLAMVHGLSKDDIHEALWEAVRAGLVFRQYDAYAFLHDRVQEAAYALIPAGERVAAHLRIGRLLVTSIPVEQREEMIFEIVNQFNRSTASITSQEEREQVAELNLIAGKRARTSTAYASALDYFAAGGTLLTEDCWERRYALSFALELHRAECEFLTGEVVAADERLSMLSLRAADLTDLAAVTYLRVNLFTSLDRSDRSVEVSLQYLQRLGIYWSPHPTQDEVTVEFAHIWQQLGSRAIEDLVDLPPMSDPAWRATMDVLATVLNPALFTDKNLLCLVIGRMTNLSLEHGNSDGSCFAYVWLGAVLGLQFGNYQAGYRFGRLGVDLVEQRGLDRFKARVYRGFGQLVNPWTRPIRTGRAFIQRAFDIAQETGDLNWACYARESLITHLLVSGDPLEEIQREAETGLAFVRKTHFGTIIAIMTGQLQLIRTLRGLTPAFGCFTDDQFDEARYEQQLEGNPGLAIAACWYWIRKLQARFFAEDYASAIRAAAQAERLLWTSPSHIEVIEYHFYGALARAAHCVAAPAEEWSQHLVALAAHGKQFAEWTEQCPENFAHRTALVGAEIAQLEGRYLDAMRLYEEAIRLAREHGFIHNEGLANELAARFYAARGFETTSHMYLRNARYCYLRWGADGKVRQLDQTHPHLCEEPASPRATSTIGTSIEHLDLATVVKVSQAVSSEIVLDKLIQTLMGIALEHAGAERGLLLLLRAEEIRVEAEATTGPETIEVRLRPTVLLPSALPESILRYVLRSQDSVLLEDASAPNQFSADEYIGQRHPRSVLCLPLVKQSQLSGVLYLENTLTPNAFTPARIAVLKLLASQAAISLENARLYTDLQQENRERQRAEEGLRRSEADLFEAQRLTHMGSWKHDVASGTVTVSPEVHRIFGNKPDEDTSTAEFFFSRIHPEDQPSEVRNYERARLAKAGFESDYRIVLPDGSIKHIHNIGHPIVNEAGELLTFIGTAMDVTEQYRARVALEKAFQEMQDLRDQHRLVIDTIPGLVWSALPDGSADFLNQRWLNYTGLSLQDALGWGWGAVIHPDDRPRLMEVWRTMLATGKPGETEARMRRVDDEYRWFLFRWVPLYDERGNLVKWYGTNTDIEDRKRAEALLAGEKRLLEMVATGDSLSLILDALCRLVEELSPDSLSSMLLLDPEGHRLWHGAAPSLPKSYIDAIDGSFIGPAAGSCGTAAYRKEPIMVADIAQDPLWAEYRHLALPHGLRVCWSTPILASDDRVLGTFAIYSREPRSPTPQQQNIIAQITDLASIAIERQRAEEERQVHLWFLESMDRVNRAIQGTNDLEQMMNDVLDAVLSIFHCDRAWLVYPCDPEAASWTVPMEHARLEFPGIFVSGRELPVDPEVAKVFQTARAADGPVRFGPGLEHPLPVEVAQRFSVQSALAMALYPKAAKSYLLGLHQCSYPRVWTPQEERLFQEIGRRLEDALTSLLMLRNLGESERRLEEAQRLTHVGYWELDPGTDLITWSDESYRICGLPPQERTITFAGLQELIHPEDRQIIVQAVAEALRSGPRYDVEYRVVRPNGEVRVVHARGDIMRDESGRPCRMFGTAQDITERKRAEEALHEAQADLTRITRVATLGELTASIAHEINQPLGAVVNSASACLRWLDAHKVEEARRSAARVIAEGHRASEIISRIRALVKKAPPRKDWLNVNEAIQEVLALAHSEVQRNEIVLALHLGEAVPLILADRIQVQQVLLNLLMNAIEAMSGSGEGPRELVVRSGTDDSQGVLVAVQDSGPGLDPQSLERLFEAFYTTKPQGLGMGLAISRSIIEAHGGRLWATANVPCGAVFQFTVPIEDERVA